MDISFVWSQECRLNRELDTKSFSTRLETSLLYDSRFTCPQFKSENHMFSIHYFAESVSYQVEGLVKKNKVRICYSCWPRASSPGVLPSLFERSIRGLLGLLSPENDVVPRLTPFLHRTLSVVASVTEMMRRLEDTARQDQFCKGAL